MSVSNQGQKPNIVFILTDDQGAWAMGCAGNKEIKTPNLDRLAQSGMRFSNFFCASPVCSPARASIMTGTIPSAHGVQDWLCGGNVNIEDFPYLKGAPGFEDEHIAIPYLQDFTTYTDVLARNGYTCALSGKWHMGDSVHPQHSFQKWHVIARGGCQYFHPDVIEDGKVVYKDRYVTDLITDKAIECLDELREEGNPFYLSVHYTAPHSPWDEDNHPKEYLDLYRDCPFDSVPDLPLHPWQAPTAPCGTGEKRRELLRGYYAAVTAMDHNVGRILDYLEENGLTENTIIVFNGDNGMNMGHHGIWGKGNGTFPQNMFDTSVKVPFIISYPGQIPQGVVCENLVSHYDIFPTLMEYLKLNPGEIRQKLPGKSFAALLSGEKKADDGCVVIFDEYGPVRMIRTAQWKYIHRYPYGPNELYNLQADPNEEHNLYFNEELAPVVQRLKARLEQWFYTYTDPAMDATKECVTGMGQLRRPGIYSEGKEVHADSKKFTKIF